MEVIGHSNSEICTFNSCHELNLSLSLSITHSHVNEKKTKQNEIKTKDKTFVFSFHNEHIYGSISFQIKTQFFSVTLSKIVCTRIS